MSCVYNCAAAQRVHLDILERREPKQLKPPNLPVISEFQFMSTCVLEICVESVDHAVAAERGGADRIELCSDLPSGGITPSAGFMQTARRQVRIPIHMLIRPRPGDFCYSDHEFQIMRDDILAARQSGMDGVVLGILRPDGQVDVERTRSLVALAHPLPVTFHRAFDVSPDLDASLEDVILTRASRILTSGGQSRAIDALPTLARLIEKAKGRILVMPGGGINSDNVVRVAQSFLIVMMLRPRIATADTNGMGPPGFEPGTSRL